MARTRSLGERSRDVERKRKARAAEKDVVIPHLPKKNRLRRKRLEKDDAKWLRYYFGPDAQCKDPFWYEFTDPQQKIIKAIGHAVVYGGDQSLAAPRGEGKSTLFRRLLIKYAFQGIVQFSVLCASTGPLAAASLEAIKEAIETNDLLCEDYPEVCVPVRALENTPNRAHYQTVSGKRFDNGKSFSLAQSRFSWCGNSIVLPDVPGSPSAGAVIVTAGLDSEVRGLNRKGRRPDLVGIDDPDTEETVNSEKQAKKLEDRIDKGLGGLGGQQRGVARVMLTTLQNRDCVSYKYTDPLQKPSWKGKRFRFMVSPPTRTDLWEEYVNLCNAGYQDLDDDGNCKDPHARKAHQFYLSNRKSMDAGSKVANPHRFNPGILPDGSQTEVSALQRYYNEVVRIGQEAVSTEYDNDPPEDSGPVESGITAYRVQRQVSGYERRIVPPGTVALVQGIDVGKFALHFVVKAFRADATAYVVDYGVQEVLGTIRGSDEAVDRHILKALYARREDMLSYPYMTEDEKPIEIQKTLVDAGYRTDSVYFFCKEAGVRFQEAMGFGKSHGCKKAGYYPPTKKTKTKKPGDGWYLSLQEKKNWLCCMDADRWKCWEHDRWMTPTDIPGTCFLFGDRGIGDKMSEDQKGHFSYSKHLTAEIEIEENGKRSFKVKSTTNHYLDASYMADVAGNICGVSLMKQKGGKRRGSFRKLG